MARHSVARTGNRAYRRGYSRSPAWFRRRDQWFQDFGQQHEIEPYCYACEVPKSQLGSLDLHHVSYEGVRRGPGNRWLAEEADDDLVPLCRHCHDQLHARMDDGKTYYGWSRENATFRIIAELRQQLAHTRQGQQLQNPRSRRT